MAGRSLDSGSVEVWKCGVGVAGYGVCGSVVVMGGWLEVGSGGVGGCARTFQGLHSMRLWTPTIFI
jgi:hypothetical protein